MSATTQQALNEACLEFERARDAFESYTYMAGRKLTAKPRKWYEARFGLASIELAMAASDHAKALREERREAPRRSRKRR